MDSNSLQQLFKRFKGNIIVKFRSVLANKISPEVRNRNLSDIACRMSMVCTDCLFNERQYFNGKCFSYKFPHSALRYEVGGRIYTGWIVWVNGTYVPRPNVDISMFRQTLRPFQDEVEDVLADGVYEDETCSKMHPFVRV